MTPEQINRAIKGWLGWTKCPCGDMSCGSWIDETQTVREWVDFYASLDAVHEAEMKLDDMQKSVYRNRLGEIVDYYSNMPFATSQQRCEALLRTLNLWQD